jgi:hypothetical protein
MAFVLSSVVPMYFTTPVQYKGHPAKAELQSLRFACAWQSYARVVAHQRHQGTQVTLFQWCLPGEGGGTVFSFASMEIEALVAYYNVLATACAAVLECVRAGGWSEVGELSGRASAALLEFDGAADKLLTVEGRDASCRPRVTHDVGDATAGMLPCVFSGAWVEVVTGALADVRQCVACHNATVQHATDETLVALEKGATVTMGNIYRALVEISLMPRSGDVAWIAMADYRTQVRAECVARGVNLTRWGTAFDHVDPIVLVEIPDNTEPLTEVTILV